jgi:hypothetical protein
MITLEHDSVEQSLADWGFALESPQAEHVNLSASRYVAFAPGASVADDPLFDFEDKIIIRRNRSGSGTSWSGGYVAFIGYAMSPRASQDGSGAGLVYEFLNAWYFLENTVFEQEFASYDSGDLEYVFITDVILFTKLNAITFLLEFQDSGEQIEEILQYASDQAVAAGFAQPYIIGTIDPDIPFPSYPVREMMCAAAVLKCLEASPDICCWFDYTTTLGSGPAVPTPTVHFYKRATRTSKSLAILNGTDHKSLDIVPRYDLQVRAVNLQYKITGSDDGNVWISQGEAQRDKYGPNGANHASDPDRGLRVIRQTIDLQGNQTMTASIEVAVVNCNSGTEETRLAWWKAKLPWLASGKIGALSIPTAASIKDDAGADVSLGTYPNELTRGQIANWMGFAQKWVTIKALATYTKYISSGAATAATANLVDAKEVEKEISVRILVTDGTSGSYLGSFIPGESIPTGIAQSVYEAMSVLQYQGNDVRVQAEIMNGAGDGPLIHLGHKLNLTGGRADWTSMDAMIQRIVEHDGTGETSISFGPARHLAAGDLAAMFQWNRHRRIWYAPALRETADPGSSGNLALGEDHPKENSTAGSGNVEIWAAVGTYDPEA